MVEPVEIWFTVDVQSKYEYENRIVSNLSSVVKVEAPEDVVLFLFIQNDEIYITVQKSTKRPH